jgi:hypothetical protein
MPKILFDVTPSITAAMKSFAIFRPMAALVSLSVLMVGSVAGAARSQSLTVPTATADQAADSASLKSTGFLSLAGGQRLMGEASSAVSSGNYGLAVKKLQEARQVFNQLSNFYQELGGSFTGVDNRIADGLRRKALDAAQMRDDATYQLALAHRAQNQPELSVPLLVQIAKSQGVTRDLGKKAYNQLVELGFADTPYPRPAQ